VDCLKTKSRLSSRGISAAATREEASQGEPIMRKPVLAMAMATVFFGAAAAGPAIAQYVQAAPSAPDKKLTPQQQKMKDCGAKWEQMKSTGTTGGQTWAQFRTDCLKKS
jgi:hypothetical protein